MMDVGDIALTIDDVEFVGRDLDMAGQELLRHIVNIRDRMQQHRFDMAQLEVLDIAFTEALRNTAPQEKSA